MRIVIIIGMTVVLFTGCSGPRSAATDDRSGREPTFEELLAELPSTETFDPSAYPVEMPVLDDPVDHDVPPALMEGRAGAGLVSNKRGYRIQVAFAREKDTADQIVEEVHGWLRSKRREYADLPALQGNIPVHNIYLQPYFRIRIGDFRTRDEAEELLAIVAEDYPRAFIVVDQVSVNN